MRKNIDYIESLKGIGAIIIAFYHISGIIGVPNSSISFLNKIMNTFSAIGYIPVEMFFFFSGYLMVYSYYDKIRDIDFFDYINKRFKSVYPFLIINIILCSLYLGISGEYVGVYQIIYNILFLQSGYFSGAGNFRIDVAGGGTWFLAPLFLSYFIFFYIFKYKSKEISFGIFTVIVIVGMIALKGNWNYPILNGYMLRGLLGFFAGCMFSLIVKKFGFGVSKLIIIVILLILFGYLSVIYREQYTDTLDFIIVTDIVIIPCVILILENVYWIKRIFSLNILKRIGSFSMQIFFLNLPVGYFLKLLIINNYEMNKYLQFVVYFFSLILSCLLFDYIVKKMRKIMTTK